VRACRGDQQAALGGQLTLHIGKVRVGQHLSQQPLGLVGGDRRLTAEVRGDFQQVFGGVDSQAGGQTGFLGIGPWHQQRTAGFTCRQGRWQDALHRTQRAGKRQLAQAFDVVQAVGGNLSTGGEDAQGDGQVETPAILGQIGRGEIQGDAPRGEVEAGRQDGAAHAVLAFLHGGFRQADQGQRRQAVGKVRLDRDARRFHAYLGTAVDDGEGHSITPLIVSPPYLLGGGRREFLFEFGDPRFEGLQACAGAGQYHHLTVEFITADDIELAQGALHDALEAGFDLRAWQGRFTVEQARGLGADGIEKSFGWEHGHHLFLSGGQCITPPADDFSGSCTISGH